MDREELSKRRFNQDEIGELIETASRLDQLSVEKGLSYEELRHIAIELGISDEALLKAVAQEIDAEKAAAELEQAERDAIEKAKRKRKKAIDGWKSHAASYIGVIGGLALIDWFSGGGLDWFFYPAAGWGIGFFIHSLTVLFGVAD